MRLGEEEIQTQEETPGVRLVHADKTRRGHSEHVAVCRPEPEASEEPGPAEAGILDLSLEEGSFCCTHSMVLHGRWILHPLNLD